MSPSCRWREELREWERWANTDSQEFELIIHWSKITITSATQIYSPNLLSGQDPLAELNCEQQTSSPFDNFPPRQFPGHGLERGAEAIYKVNWTVWTVEGNPYLAAAATLRGILELQNTVAVWCDKWQVLAVNRWHSFWGRNLVWIQACLYGLLTTQKSGKYIFAGFGTFSVVDILYWNTEASFDHNNRPHDWGHWAFP